MNSKFRTSLQGLKIVSFESRRAKEMAELIRRYGGDPIVAPSMREIPFNENRAALDLLPQLEGGHIDLLVLMTGVGTKALYEALLTKYSQERITAALRKTTLVARGPKPVGALRALGLQPAFTAAEPNTWHEVVSMLRAGFEMRGKRVAIQEYGAINKNLATALESLGGHCRFHTDLSLGSARRSRAFASSNLQNTPGRGPCGAVHQRHAGGSFIQGCR